MTRPRKRKQIAVGPVAVGAVAPAASVLPADTEVLVRGKSIRLNRAEKGTWITIPTELVEPYFAEGLVASREQIDRIWANAACVLSPTAVLSQYHAPAYDPSALKVLQVTAYDPGSSVYRYTSAALMGGLTSVLVRHGHTNAHCDLRHYDAEIDAATVQLLCDTADVVHSHMDYYVLRNVIRQGTREGLIQALTYHGSVDPQNLPGSIRVNEAGNDDRMDAVVFGARPYHHRFKVKHWLPIPMPVEDYQVLRKEEKREGKTFRVAHSPTMRRIKGTQEFLRACDYLKMHEGIDIEPVLIEGLEHGKALRLKASCDAAFDSFWLGMQGSGLEAAAMGLPVLAGDPEAQNDLTKLGIPVPWTVANDEQGIRDGLAKLVRDPTFRQAEAARVHAYVRQYHDYPVVGRKYAEILTEAKRNGPPYRS